MNKLVYPLFFKPVYKERVWGGVKMKEVFGRELPNEFTGESWDVACHDHGMSVIENGDLAGKTILEVIKENPTDYLGTTLKTVDKFPLLVKILDAKEKLSVQVHPQDQYAKEYENGELGKCEMWYIIDVEPGAKLIMGIQEGTTKDEFRTAIENGVLEPLLTELDVEKGDVLNIPAGMVHAIGEGILIAEIQQNSDTVYRVYDWNRVGLDGKPRELHVEKALDVIDFSGVLNKEKVEGLSIQRGESTQTYYIANEYFGVEKIQLQGEITENANGLKFYLYTCVEGEGIIKHMGKNYAFHAGQSFMIPAAMGMYEVSGEAVLLKSYVPDVEEDFLHPLVETGYKKDMIDKMTAIMIDR